jgi:hypothetical protein
MSHARWQMIEVVLLPPMLIFCEDFEFFINYNSASGDENNNFPVLFHNSFL